MIKRLIGRLFARTINIPTVVILIKKFVLFSVILQKQVITNEQRNFVIFETRSANKVYIYIDHMAC